MKKEDFLSIIHALGACAGDLLIFGASVAGRIINRNRVRK